jgi:hypothetical protein
MRVDSYQLAPVAVWLAWTLLGSGKNLEARKMFEKAAIPHRPLHILLGAFL